MANNKGVRNVQEELIKIIRHEQARLFRLANSYVHDEHQALDIVQITVEKAFRKLKQIKEPKYLKIWLIRILINTAIDMQRKNQQTKEYTTEVKKDLVTPISVSLEQQIALAEELKQLSEMEQQVIKLHIFEELSLDETANIIGKPTSTIKSLYYRSLKKLEKKLGE